MKKKQKLSTMILLTVFFVGLSVMLYPALSSYWNSRTQSMAIVDYEKMLAEIAPEDYTELFQKADDYNERLSKLKAPLLEHYLLEDYLDILSVNSAGMMGYITIEKINVDLPVYHTTDDNVLSVGVGHFQGTSLPVGGPGTHSVLSAHRGLPTATLFTHLDALEIGDTFVITILDRAMVYQVDQIKVVNPDDASDIRMFPDEEYCTLLTCTPYGINSHRLLVRGTRIETLSQKKIYITSDAYRIDTLIVTPAVAIPMVMILMVIVLLKPVKKDDLGDDL